MEIELTARKERYTRHAQLEAKKQQEHLHGAEGRKRAVQCQLASGGCAAQVVSVQHVSQARDQPVQKACVQQLPTTQKLFVSRNLN